jgi:hypothetical protein
VADIGFFIMLNFTVHYEHGAFVLANKHVLSSTRSATQTSSGDSFLKPILKI